MVSRISSKAKPDSLVIALIIVGYNCLVVPVSAFVLVFAWREAIGSIYGYAKYHPVNVVLIFLLLAAVVEIAFVVGLSEAKNRKGRLIGLAVSLVLSPGVLLLIWFSLILGNR